MMLLDAHTHTMPEDSSGHLALVNLKPGAAEGKGKNDHILFSCGIHPAEAELFTLPELRETLTRIPCSAVGECGLDAQVPIPLEQQEKLFQAQILIAEELHLPMVIHCVRKYYDLIRLRKILSVRMPWLIHGFRGKPQIGEALLHAGCLLSLAPVWLLRQTDFPSWLPPDSFLIETDECSLPLSALYTHTAGLLRESEKTLADRLQGTFLRFLRQEI